MINNPNKTSTFVALRNPVYRRLWIPSLISGICVAAHDTAAMWVMHRLHSSTFFLSLISTVASLPLFLFTLPAGALADLIDRRTLLRIVNLWLATAAGSLALLGWLRFLSPYVLLFSVFTIGVGFAFNAPAWSAMIADVVTPEELPSAGTLGGLQFNLSGILGPVLGGLLLYLFGTNAVFAVNAACFLGVILALSPRRLPEKERRLPTASFLESVFMVIRYVWRSPSMRVILGRNVLFAFFISALPALMPVVGLKELRLQPCSLGLLFTSMGVGSVCGAVFVLPRLRASFSSNASTVLANFLEVVTFLLMAFVRQPLVFMVVAALAGMGWTIAAPELWVAGQRNIPEWARGRLNAIVIVVSQGGMTIGGIVWAFLSQTAGVNATLVLAATTFAISLLLAIPLSINPVPVTSLNLRPLSRDAVQVRWRSVSRHARSPRRTLFPAGR